ncbi:MAG: hypothetical protein ABI876_10590, partial [Bacteroidota bacterium]
MVATPAETIGCNWLRRKFCQYPGLQSANPTSPRGPHANPQSALMPLACIIANDRNREIVHIIGRPTMNGIETIRCYFDLAENFSSDANEFVFSSS